MAALISKASGNLSASTTWFLVDSTSLLDSEAGNTELTTSYVESSSFTPGAITIDGIAIKLAARASSPTGTVSVRLAQAGATVSGTEVTINATDLPYCDTTNKQGGWILFKFASPVTLAAATAYTVSGKESVATANVYFYRNSTANNWSRMLRTTTEQAPAAGDQLDIMGEHTGAGTGNNFTVTNDLTATTDFGSGTDGAVAVTISKRGTLNYGYSASTNYYLKCSGNVIVYNGGTFTIGTVANPIPRTSTAVLEFDPVADGGMGLIVRQYGVFTAQGLSRTSGKNIVSCKLNTDEAAGQTVLGVDTDTGWLNGDVIVIASTTQTPGQTEQRTLSGDAGASSITVSAGLTNAHSGTSPTQAEVILLTRYVKIRSATSTIMTFCKFAGYTTVDIDWVEFYYIGENATDKYGVDVSSGATFDMAYSSLHDGEDWGYYTSSSSSSATYNTFYNLNNAANSNSVDAIYLFGNSNTIFNNNVILACGSTNNTYKAVVRYATSYITYQNNTIAGCTMPTGSPPGGAFIGGSAVTFSNLSGNVIHSCNCGGIVASTSTGWLWYGTLNGFTIWRNAGGGILFATANGGVTPINLTISNTVLFGNSTYSIYLAGTYQPQHWIILDNVESSGDTSFATTNGIYISTNSTTYQNYIKMLNCKFSEAGGIRAVHTNDVNVAASWNGQIIANNCLFNGTNELVGITSGTIRFIRGDQFLNFFKSTNHDQNGSHLSAFMYGIISSDSAAGMYRTASPSMRLRPNNASYKLESGSFKVNVNSGQTCTPSVYVRESVAGDGADYTGNRPRLILKRNDAIGITADTVIDTATASAEGAFEQLTGTTAAASADGVMEFIIDCDGGAGWVNVDDFSATVA